MALSSSIVWEFRATATASMVNGGGFKTGASGTDFSQQNAAQYALTSVTSAGAGDTFLTASAANDMVGNVCNVVSGTNFTVGWYEIIAVSVGVSVQVDRSLTTGIGASGVINVGGALSLNSTLDDDFFEAVVGGNTIYFKAGTYTVGEAINVASTASTAIAPSYIVGYNATRGDNPTGSNRPVISCGANSLTLGQFQNIENCIITSTAAAGLSIKTAYAKNCKSTNTSTTAARSAFTFNSSSGSDTVIYNCEAISQNGIGLQFNGNSRCRAVHCYIHDCDTGISGTAAGNEIMFCIIEACSTVGAVTTSTTSGWLFLNNTFYGREGKVGIGINLNANPCPNNRIFGNIFYGLTTGVNVLTAEQKSNFSQYNDYFNNTADVALLTKDSTDLAVDPTFSGATQITGTTATTSGSVLTQSGGDFSTVTDNVDILHVTSGTGVTTGGYLITSHDSTTLTVNNALGTSSAGDVVYFVTTGHNFSVGTNLKALATASIVFSGSDTLQYVDVGGAQRQEQGSGMLVNATMTGGTR